MFNQQPASAVAAAVAAIAPRPYEDPRSLELVPVERELQIALVERLLDVVDLRRPRARVPEHDDTRAVSLGNHTLERSVLEWMILDVHRQTLGLWIERRAFWHRPREQHPVVLEAEVVVEMAGQVLLDAEEERGALRFGLWQ